MITNVKKNNMKQFGIVLALLLLFAACEEKDYDYASKEVADREAYIKANNITSTPTSEGIYFIPEVTTDGRSVLDGNIVKIQYSISLTNGKRVIKSQAQYFKIGEGYYINERNTIAGLEIGIKKMKQGEKASIIIPSELANGELGTELIPQYSTLIYQIELLSANIEADETDAISSYIEKIPELTYKTDEAIYFYKTTTVEDNVLEYPEDGDKITLTYKGYFLTGNIFDKNTEGFEVTLGKESVVEGFESAIALLKKGESCTALLPSAKAYSSTGSGTTIPPYTPILFDITRTE